jgi:uncharacterized protein YjbJ (UPF0337 family)
MQRTNPVITAAAVQRRTTAALVSSCRTLAPAARHYAEGPQTSTEKGFKEGGEKYDRQARGEPSMLSGHAQYVKGAVEQTLGSMIGSESLKKTGQEDKEAGVTEMKAAYHGQDDWMSPELEKKLGKVIGCEGMAEIGDEKLRKKHDQ